MKLLALDTATEACSAALWIDGVVHERFEVVRQQHSARILAMVDAVLKDAGVPLAECDALVFGRGPGSFTSLRIGAGVAQGLAYGAGLPVAGVSSLAALAQGAQVPRALAALDARMEQVYWGAYARDADGIVAAIGEEQVSDPPHIDMPEESGWVGVGSGWDRYADRLLVVLDGRVDHWRADCYPHAADVARLGVGEVLAGRTAPAATAVPRYLRDNVARRSAPAE